MMRVVRKEPFNIVNRKDYVKLLFNRARVKDLIIGAEDTYSGIDVAVACELVGRLATNLSAINNNQFLLAVYRDPNRLARDFIDENCSGISVAENSMIPLFQHDIGSTIPWLDNSPNTYCKILIYQGQKILINTVIKVE